MPTVSVIRLAGSGAFWFSRRTGAQLLRISRSCRHPRSSGAAVGLARSGCCFLRMVAQHAWRVWSRSTTPGWNVLFGFPPPPVPRNCSWAGFLGRLFGVACTALADDGDSRGGEGRSRLELGDLQSPEFAARDADGAACRRVVGRGRPPRGVAGAVDFKAAFFSAASARSMARLSVYGGQSCCCSGSVLLPWEAHFAVGQRRGRRPIRPWSRSWTLRGLFASST